MMAISEDRKIWIKKFLFHIFRVRIYVQSILMCIWQHSYKYWCKPASSILTFCCNLRKTQNPLTMKYFYDLCCHIICNLFILYPIKICSCFEKFQIHVDSGFMSIKWICIALHWMLQIVDIEVIQIILFKHRKFITIFYIKHF